MADSISDMIICLKNASAVRKTSVLVPYSAMKMSIAQLLEKEGFVGAASRKGRKAKKFIDIELLYREKEPLITAVKRISKPSRRVYRQVHELHPVRRGYGRLILSTPKGILTGENARREKVGGEALFTIW